MHAHTHTHMHTHTCMHAHTHNLLEAGWRQLEVLKTRTDSSKMKQIYNVNLLFKNR